MTATTGGPAAEEVVDRASGLPGATAESAAAIATTLVSTTQAYWSHVLDRGAWPSVLLGDALAWATESARRARPQWSTPHRVVIDGFVSRLRDFSTDEPVAGEIPTLLLPPQAGHDSCIVDFAPDQSQVGTALAAGLTRVYSMDWKGATARTKNARIEEYLVALEEAVEHLGGRAHLVGDCQGGWLAVIWTALNPDRVASLTIGGAPVDFHAGEPLIHDWVKLLTPGEDLAFYRAVVALNGGVLPGEFLLNGFKVLQPQNEVQRRLGLLTILDDEHALDRYRRFEDWFSWTQPIPGSFYLWIVSHLFQRNELVAGTLRAGGRRVDLGRITCPLFLLAGETDHITPPPQVFALADYAGTPEADVHREVVPGGHLGLFMGHTSLTEHWAPLFARIKALPQG